MVEYGEQIGQVLRPLEIDVEHSILVQGAIQANEGREENAAVTGRRAKENTRKRKMGEGEQEEHGQQQKDEHDRWHDGSSTTSSASSAAHAPPIEQTISVTLFNSNHCPGSVMFLFRCHVSEPSEGRMTDHSSSAANHRSPSPSPSPSPVPIRASRALTFLHTGDLRFDPLCFHSPSLQAVLGEIDQLYFDATFLSMRALAFPDKTSTVDECIKAIKRIKSKAEEMERKEEILYGNGENNTMHNGRSTPSIRSPRFGVGSSAHHHPHPHLPTMRSPLPAALSWRVYICCEGLGSEDVLRGIRSEFRESFFIDLERHPQLDIRVKQLRLLDRMDGIGEELAAEAEGERDGGLASGRASAAWSNVTVGLPPMVITDPSLAHRTHFHIVPSRGFQRFAQRNRMERTEEKRKFLVERAQSRMKAAQAHESSLTNQGAYAVYTPRHGRHKSAAELATASVGVAAAAQAIAAAQSAPPPLTLYLKPSTQWFVHNTAHSSTMQHQQRNGMIGAGGGMSPAFGALPLGSSYLAKGAVHYSAALARATEDSQEIFRHRTASMSEDGTLYAASSSSPSPSPSPSSSSTPVCPLPVRADDRWGVTHILYSMHSSLSEIVQFIQWLNPRSISPINQPTLFEAEYVDGMAPVKSAPAEHGGGSMSNGAGDVTTAANQPALSRAVRQSQVLTWVDRLLRMHWTAGVRAVDGGPADTPWHWQQQQPTRQRLQGFAQPSALQRPFPTLRPPDSLPTPAHAPAAVHTTNGRTREWHATLHAPFPHTADGEAAQWLKGQDEARVNVAQAHAPAQAQPPQQLMRSYSSPVLSPVKQPYGRSRTTSDEKRSRIDGATTDLDTQLPLPADGGVALAHPHLQRYTTSPHPTLTHMQQTSTAPAAKRLRLHAPPSPLDQLGGGMLGAVPFALARARTQVQVQAQTQSAKSNHHPAASNDHSQTCQHDVGKSRHIEVVDLTGGAAKPADPAVVVATSASTLNSSPAPTSPPPHTRAISPTPVPVPVPRTFNSTPFNPRHTKQFVCYLERDIDVEVRENVCKRLRQLGCTVYAWTHAAQTMPTSDSRSVSTSSDDNGRASSSAILSNPIPMDCDFILLAARRPSSLRLLLPQIIRKIEKMTVRAQTKQHDEAGSRTNGVGEQPHNGMVDEIDPIRPLPTPPRNWQTRPVFICNLDFLLWLEAANDLPLTPYMRHTSHSGMSANGLPLPSGARLPSSSSPCPSPSPCPCPPPSSRSHLTWRDVCLWNSLSKFEQIQPAHIIHHAQTQRNAANGKEKETSNGRSSGPTGRLLT